jgi:folylpolyglutamate synthase/dihydropteroate synthase
MDVLGHTLDKIAGEKGGIFKQHIPAFTVSQQGEAMSSLLRIANSKPNPLFLTPSFSSLNKTGDKEEEVNLPQLGLDGNFQRENAALALSLSATWLTHHTRPELCWWLHPSSSSSSSSSTSSFQLLPSEKALNSFSTADPSSSSFEQFHRHTFSDLFGNSFKLSEGRCLSSHFPVSLSLFFSQILTWLFFLCILKGFRDGLKNCKWAGRCHTISPETSKHFSEATSLHKTILHLDGAHTPESTTVAAEWFNQIVTSSPSSSSSASSSSSSSSASSPASSWSPSSFNVLIFNCLPSRDPRTLLAPLLRPKLFDYVIFSPIIRRGGTLTAMSTLTKPPSSSVSSSSTTSSSSSSSSSVTKWQQHTKNIWNELYRQTITTTELDESAVVVVASLEELLEKLKWIEDQVVVQGGEESGGEGIKTLNGEVRKAKEVRVMVTGSLYLVGGVLGLLTEKGVPDLI